MSSAKRVVVTGLGVICANGIGTDQVWNNCLAGRSGIKAISRFETKRYSCTAAGEVEGFDASRYVAPAVISQTDRSAHMGIAACKMAAEDANLSLKDEDPNQVGMYFSNLVGGMEFAEPELYAQAFLGSNRVSAYQAIAWFYAATQGQWSIQAGIKGFSKTIVADRTGGLQGLGLAAHAIRHGHSSVVFAGGFEAPLVPYAFLMYGTNGLLSMDTADPLVAYRPFHRRRSGLVLGEGSGILMLEDLDHALARGARIYAEIGGFSVTSDSPADGPGDGLARCFTECLKSSDLGPSEIDHISAEGVATVEDDSAEAAAIRRVFTGLWEPPTVSAPKSMFGHTLAAAGAIDAALACRMVSDNTILPTANLDDPDPQLRLAGLSRKAEQKPVDAVMCCSRGMGGLNTALIVQAYRS